MVLGKPVEYVHAAGKPGRLAGEPRRVAGLCRGLVAGDEVGPGVVPWTSVDQPADSLAGPLLAVRV